MDIAVLGMRVDTSQLRGAKRDVDGLTTSAKGAAVGAAKFARALGALGVAAGAMAVLNRASVAAGQFGTALAEVSTLIEGTPAQMAKLRAESIKLSNAYGGTATRNTKAFYQAISAGASTVEDAARIVDQANKLAVGGLTDVFTATDALTSVMNAYAESGLTAAQASDSMFVAVKAGKTTVTELAGAIGRIAPFASAAGVSFDELNASIAAITAKGINTNEAVTGLRQALISIVDPSEQAKQLAADLRFEFSGVALEAQGLEGFLASLADATDGNVQKLTELLGSAEAANAVLALLAGNGEKFSATLDMMGAKVGATDAAVEKMADTLENRMAVAMATIETALLGTGDKWLNLKVVAAESTAQIITDVDHMVKAVSALLQGEWKQAWEEAGNVEWIRPGSPLDQWWQEFFGPEAQADAEVQSKRMAESFNAGLDDYLRDLEDARVQANAIYRSWISDANLAMISLRANVAQGIDDGVNAALTAASGTVEKQIIPGFEMVGQRFKLMGNKMAETEDGAEGTADALAKADAEAAGLASNLGTAASNAQKIVGTLTSGALSSYIDKTFGSLGSLGGRTMTIRRSKRDFDFSPIEDQAEAFRELQSASAAAAGGLYDDSREIRRAITEINRAVGEYSPGALRAALTGGADKPGFWENFRSLAVSSWVSIMESSFSSGGAAMNAITDGLSAALEGVITYNAQQVSKAYAAIPRTFDWVFDNKKLATLPVRSRPDSALYNSFYNKAFEGLTVKELTDYGLGGVIGKNTNIKEFWSVLTKTIKETQDDTDVDTGDGGVKLPPLETVTLDDLLNQKNISVDGMSIQRDYTQKFSKQSSRLTKIVGNVAGDIRDTIRIFSDSIGGASDRINKVKLRFKGSVGVGEDAVERAKDLLVEGVEDYSEKVARAVLKGRDDIRMAGEKWTEALERIAKDYWGIATTMNLLGGQQFKNSINGASYASQLVQQFGDAETFNAAASGFFNVAYSSDQQQSQIRGYLRDVFKSIGLDPKELPKTREAYQNLVLSFDLEKKIGRERYSTLISMSGMFDAILPAFDAAASSIDNAATQTNKYKKAMDFASTKLTELISEANAAGRRFEQLSESLANTADIIRGMGQSSTVTFDILEARFASLYKKGLAGDADAMDQIRDVAQAYATAYGSRATSSAEYAFITASIGNRLDQLSGVAAKEAELSYYEGESLQALKDNLDNGKLTNKLIRQTNNAVGGMSKRMIKALGAIYTAQTGKTLKLSSGAAANARTMSGDDQSYKDGAKAANDTNKTSAESAADREVIRMNKERRNLMKQQIRIEKRNARHNKRATRVLERWDGNGLPATAS